MNKKKHDILCKIRPKEMFWLSVLEFLNWYSLNLNDSKSTDYQSNLTHSNS